MKHIKQAKPRVIEDQKKLSFTVDQIIQTVRSQGDQALLTYNQKFDQNSRTVFRISHQEIDSAYGEVDEKILSAIHQAARNLERFALLQKDTIGELAETELSPGVFAGHKAIPVSSCCCYIPGGGYPLFSSALMLAIPAKVAGVKRIVACSPTIKGTQKIHPATLVALDMAGVEEIYAVGGAHAVAAFAYGTGQIPAVDMIVGPGNQYVTEAKKQVYGQVGIDFIAGPSEVLVIADHTANPSFIAADLLAQSEHDLLAKGILITTSEEVAINTLTQVEKQLARLSTREIAAAAWKDHGEIILVSNLEEACHLSNEFAPEHLELMTVQNEVLEPYLINFGSLFIGNCSAEVFGDYITGTNHTLPTLKAARYTGGVWVGTFTKICTYQRVTEEGLRSIGRAACQMAEAEGLAGHRNASAIRCHTIDLE